MYETADRVAVTLLALMASDEEWGALVGAHSIGDLQKTSWVQVLGIGSDVLLPAAEEIRANVGAFEQIRPLVRRYCPEWPCWGSGLWKVIQDLFRMYYELRQPPGGASA